MRILIKDENDNVMVLSSVNGFIPLGYTLVPQEEIEAEELSLARKDRLAAIRVERDQKLLSNDKQWLIASKKSEDTTALEADAQILRDLPELAETELALLETVEDVKAYDCFTGLVLSGSYE